MTSEKILGERPVKYPAARSTSAIPRLSLPANPQVSASANIHEFSLVEGNVQIGAGVGVAPGTAVTAGKGASVFIGDHVRLLPGVIIEAIAGLEVITPDASSAAYSIYLGAGCAIAHKSLVHSPAFVGDGCFVGFRATLFNARLGPGCVVLSHALVQDVEVPPGRCVPAGAVITSQHQADQLPKVRPEDLTFVQEIIGEPLQSKFQLVSVQSATQQPSRSSSKNHSSNYFSDGFSRTRPSQASRSNSVPSRPRQFSQATQGATMQALRLSPDIVQQVRQHLSAGYRIGMEHADKRRYRSGVWETCTPIKETREQAVFEALERCLQEHKGEYVRMFGIDPKVKQRVGMMTVQRPGDPGVEKSTGAASTRGSYSSQSRNSTRSSSGQLDAGIAQEVRNLLNAGYQIGTEHAGPRHYRSNVWKVCSPIESRNEREVFAKLEHCLAEHSGEYVRMFGINANANSRSATTTIQRADGKPLDISNHTVPTVDGTVKVQAGNYEHSSSHGADVLGDETAQAVGHIIRGGNVVGIEFADKRRYRSGIWQTAPSIKASSAPSALIQLQNFISENPDKYVRIFGVNSRMKTRGTSTTVQKPGQANSQRSGNAQGAQQQHNASMSGREAAREPINENPPHYDDPAFRGQPVSGDMDPDVMNQVTQLVQQGHKISIEFADKRRYRSGIWKTGPAIRGRRPADVISELGEQLAQHSNDYVRLVGIDTQAKRRVAEVTIQKPGQKSSSSKGLQGMGSRRDPINANPPHYDDPAFRGQPSSYGQSGGYNSNGQSGRYNTQTGNYDRDSNGGIESAVMDKVTQLVQQGHKISLEFADKRRYRSGIWKTGSAIAARRPAEAISELGKQLARHQGEYVRLIGTDTSAKRRVLETTIQRP